MKKLKTEILYKNDWDWNKVKYLCSAELTKEEMKNLNISSHKVAVLYGRISKKFIIQYDNYKSQHLYEDMFEKNSNIFNYLNRYLLLI